MQKLAPIQENFPLPFTPSRPASNSVPLNLFDYRDRLLVSDGKSTTHYDKAGKLIPDNGYFCLDEPTLAFNELNNGHVQVTPSGIYLVGCKDVHVKVDIETAVFGDRDSSVSAIYLFTLTKDLKEIQAWTVDSAITEIATTILPEATQLKGKISMDHVVMKDMTISQPVGNLTSNEVLVLASSESHIISVLFLKYGRAITLLGDENVADIRIVGFKNNIFLLIIDVRGTFWCLTLNIDNLERITLMTKHFYSNLMTPQHLWYTGFVTSDPTSRQLILTNIDNDGTPGISMFPGQFIYDTKVESNPEILAGPKNSINMVRKSKDIADQEGIVIAGGKIYGTPQEVEEQISRGVALEVIAEGKICMGRYLPGIKAASGMVGLYFWVNTGDLFVRLGFVPGEERDILYELENQHSQYVLMTAPWVRECLDAIPNYCILLPSYSPWPESIYLTADSSKQAVEIRHGSSNFSIEVWEGDSYGEVLFPETRAAIRRLMHRTCLQLLWTVISDWWAAKLFCNNKADRRLNITERILPMLNSIIYSASECPRLILCMLHHTRSILLGELGIYSIADFVLLEQNIPQLTVLTMRIKYEIVTELVIWANLLTKEWVHYMDKKKERVDLSTYELPGDGIPHNLSTYELPGDGIPHIDRIANPKLWALSLCYRQMLFGRKIDDNTVSLVSQFNVESSKSDPSFHDPVTQTRVICLAIVNRFSYDYSTQPQHKQKLVKMLDPFVKNINIGMGLFHWFYYAYEPIFNFDLLPSDITLMVKYIEKTIAHCAIPNTLFNNIVLCLMNYFRRNNRLIDGYRLLSTNKDLLPLMGKKCQAEFLRFQKDGRLAQEALLLSLLVEDENPKAKAKPKSKKKRVVRKSETPRQPDKKMVPSQTKEVQISAEAQTPIVVDQPKLEVDVVPQTPVKPWKTIGRISLLGKHIGLGSHGTLVYKGLWENKLPCAVKVLQLAFWPSANAEADAFLKTWTSDSIPTSLIRYYGREVDDIEDKLYLALELCGTTVAAEVKAGNLNKPKIQLQLFQEVTTAVAFLHQSKIVHNDVTPHNILIKTPDAPSFKLTDLGISKQIETNDSFTFTSNTSVGSGGFHSAEVLLGQAKSSKVDIFSLGVTFFYVITGGKNPFGDQKSRQSAATAISHKEPASLSGLSPLQSQLLERMLSHNPKHRPTASEILEHPMLWSIVKIQAFLHSISNAVEVSSDKHILDKKLVDLGVIPKNWGAANYCPSILWNYITESRKYNGTSPTDLLRAVRNLSEHWDSVPPNISSLFGDRSDGIISWLETTFPNFIIGIWEITRKGL